MEGTSKEQFLKRLKASKERKKECMAELVDDMKARFEQRTGQKANVVEVW